MNGWTPCVFPVIHRSLHDYGDVVDSPASDTDRHTRSGFQLRPETSAFQLGANLARDILQSTVRKVLPDEQKQRKLHSWIISAESSILPFAFEHPRILA